MSAEENKTILRRRVDEIWNHGKLEVIDELIADDYMSNGQVIGREGFRQFVNAVRALFLTFISRLMICLLKEIR